MLYARIVMLVWHSGPCKCGLDGAFWISRLPYKAWLTGWHAGNPLYNMQLNASERAGMLKVHFLQDAWRARTAAPDLHALAGDGEHGNVVPNLIP